MRVCARVYLFMCVCLCVSWQEERQRERDCECECKCVSVCVCVCVLSCAVLSLSLTLTHTDGREKTRAQPAGRRQRRTADGDARASLGQLPRVIHPSATLHWVLPAVLRLTTLSTHTHTHTQPHTTAVDSPPLPPTRAQRACTVLGLHSDSSMLMAGPVYFFRCSCRLWRDGRSSGTHAASGHHEGGAGSLRGRLN